MMNTQKLLALSAIALTFALSSLAQDSVNTAGKKPAAPECAVQQTRYLLSRKHRVYFYWGYNREAYTNSDIHFWEKGYDFKIFNVIAQDEPEHDFSTYYGPGSFTVPEYSYRVGYYLNDQTFVSLGHDHMKYIIYKQPVMLSGVISKDNNNGENIGVYNQKEVLVGKEDGNDQTNGNSGPSVINSLQGGFVDGFEHCDGLNYINAEIGRREQIWISKRHKDALCFVGTVDAGITLLDTDCDVLGYPNVHGKAYHLGGFGFSGSLGLEFDFCKNIFCLAQVKGGYLNLCDINTTTTGGKASQHFYFAETMFVVGYSFHVGK